MSDIVSWKNAFEQCIGQSSTEVVIPEPPEALPSSPKNNKEKFKSLMSNINQKVIKTLDKLKSPNIAPSNTVSPAISRSNSTEKRRIVLSGKQPGLKSSNLQQSKATDEERKPDDQLMYNVAFNALIIVAVLAILWIGWYA